MRQHTAIEDEHLRRMAEPEPLRTLRRQKERIEDEFIQGMRRRNYEAEAEELRKEIRRLGHKPES